MVNIVSSYLPAAILAVHENSMLALADQGARPLSNGAQATADPSFDDPSLIGTACLVACTSYT